MPKAKQLAASSGGSSDETELSFYDALQAGDIERLMACWADEDDVVCVHPGGPRIVGLGAIRSAFEAIFNSGTIRIQIEALHTIASMTSAVHSLRERIELLTREGSVVAYVIATNVYHKTAQGWRMVAHHASPATGGVEDDANHAPQVLH